MELLPAIETLQWLAEHGPRILAGERIALLAHAAPVKRGRWTYEPLGVVARARPGRRAVRHAARRRRRRADGRQRRRPQAVAARGAGRRADRPRLRARRAAARACCGSSTATPTPARALVEAPRRPGALHRLGARRARGRRGVRPRRSSAASLELGGTDADARAAPTRTSTRAARGVVWAAFANAGPVRRQRSSAPIVLREVARPLPRRRGAPRARALRVGDPRRTPRREVGPLVARERLDRVRELVDDAVAARRDAALRRPGRRRRPGAAPFFAPAV